MMPETHYSYQVRKVSRAQSTDIMSVRSPPTYSCLLCGIAPTWPPTPYPSQTLPFTQIRKMRIWQWEERTVNEQGSLAGAASPTGDNNLNSKKGAVANALHRLTLIKYMVQFIVTMPERYPVSAARHKDSNAAQQTTPTDAIVKTMEIMYKLLQAPYWDDLDIDAMFPKVTEAVLCSEHKQDEKIDVWSTRMVNTIQILKVFLDFRPSP